MPTTRSMITCKYSSVENNRIRSVGLILAFTCHEAHGGQCLAYSPSYQLLVSGGKRGDVSIFDLRQRKRLATSQAHDSHLKALSLDPLEKFYVTGSTEGNIKVNISLDSLKNFLFF